MKIDHKNHVLMEINTYRHILVKDEDIVNLLNILHRTCLVELDYQKDIVNIAKMNTGDICLKFISEDVLKKFIAAKALLEEGKEEEV